MKITSVENEDIVYIITKKPNWFERLFGKKEIKEKYIDTGSYFARYPDVAAFYSFNGEVVGPLGEMCEVLNNAKRKKEVHKILNKSYV